MKPTHVGTIKLPERPPHGARTLLDFFVNRFPRIPRDEWTRRFSAGMITRDNCPVRADDPYCPLLELRYAREVEREWPVRRDFRIVYEDRDLLVADKPPFLPVTPGGRYQRNCLLGFLRDRTRATELTPLHRLDKDTSGLALFAKRAESRGHLARLFLEPRGPLTKEYHALCELRQPARCPAPGERMRLENHVARDGTAYHLQAIYPDRPVNAVCDIETIAANATRVLLRVFPLTGRKHQLRVQLSHEGYPIVNDRLYGTRPRHAPDDLSAPLQLNCHRLAIRDFPTCAGGRPLSMEWFSEMNLEPLSEPPIDIDLH